MSVLSQKLKLSVNPCLINKNEHGDKTLFSKGWLNKSLTPGELAREIDKGVAYCCQLSGPRCASNFLCSDAISVDIDGTRRIEEVMRDPLVERCLTIFYTTPSHTPENHRFRLVFALPRTIESSADMVAASRSLSLRLSGDPTATDTARIFYGSRGSIPSVFDRAIDLSLLNELIDQGRDAGQTDTKGARSIATAVSRRAIEPNQVIITARGQKMEFSQLAIRTAICCPFHHDINASAFVLESRAGVKGLHCSTCAQTFWPIGTALTPYNFFEFENRVREVRHYFEKHKDPGPLRELFVNEHPIRVGLTTANITITADEYLRLDRLEDGLTLIKSPKGTGKTKRLRSLLKDGHSTLLIGHRVALIRQSCERLGLECYLDIDGPLTRQRLGVCLDSLQRLNGSNQLTAFKTIIIDESEQVLSHFLSETMERGNRDAIFVIFKALLRRARRVIALDADLGWLTFETLSKLVNSNVKGASRRTKPVRTHIYLNDRATNKDIQIFRYEYHLRGDLKRSLAEGKRVFVTSNSKGRINEISESIAAEFKGTIRQLKITSDTVNSDSTVQAFIENPGKHALDYNLILTSPSLGTGVDIAFEEKSELIDVVYGFFDALVTTHFDFDQQLARVRHPGAIKVWLTPRIFRFDTAMDVIRRDILRDNLYKNTLVDFDELGRPKYLQDDAFLDMASFIVSQQRASKNNLKRHFIELKRYQGYTVGTIEPDEIAWLEGQGLSRLGKGLSAERRISALLGAAPLRKLELQQIEDRLAESEEVSEPKRWSQYRTWIEWFYRERITPSLIDLDDGGKYRKKVLLFEAVVRSMRADAGMLATAELRSALEFTRTGRQLNLLGARLRFLKQPSDVITTICYLLFRTPLARQGVLTPATVTMDDLREFTGALLQNKPIIENVLDLEVRADVEAKPMTQLNGILKLIGLSCKALKKNKAGGRIVYPYRMHQESYDRMLRFVEQRRVSDGWDAVYEMNGWDMLKELEGEEPAMTEFIDHFKNWPRRYRRTRTEQPSKSDDRLTRLK